MASTTRDEPQARKSARSVVHEELRRRIIATELLPGAPLSENELASALRVSRTPVRESLILLADEGLVQVFPQLGSFVARLDVSRIADAQFVREAIEVASLRDTVRLLDRARLDELRAILQRQARAETPEEFFPLDEAFHQSLLAAGGHATAWRAVQPAKAHLDRARRLGLRTVSPLPVLIGQHTAVVDALEAGDLAGAEAAMQIHLRLVFDDVERIRVGSPELFAGDDDERPVRRSVVSWA